MSWIDRALLFSPLDYVALSVLLVGWVGIAVWIEHASEKRPSMSRLMIRYQHDWLRQLAARDNRIVDAQIIASLRQGTAFFASTTVIAIGGALAVFGNADRLTTLASDLIQAEAPLFVWEVKILLVTLFLSNAFLKFAWANRLFGYVSVLIGALPNDPADPEAQPRAEQAAEVNVLAARSFNRGLRALYFALASVAWIAGPVPLILAALTTLGLIWRREFASRSRSALMGKVA